MKASITRRWLSVKTMRKDTVITRPATGLKGRAQVGGGMRGNIKELTRKSIRRMKLHFRNMPESGQFLVTLTYPLNYSRDGKAVKYDLRKIRQWFKYNGVSGAWFLEFQARGAPHYHIVTDKWVDKHKLSEAWFKIVGSGDEKHLKAGTNQERLRCRHAIEAYVAKYASKAEQKEVPADYQNVGRFWGSWGDMRCVSSEVLHGETGSSDSEQDENGYRLQSVLRSLRKLKKSQGYKVKDGGVYGFVLWGVGAATVAKLSEFYAYNGVPFS